MAQALKLFLAGLALGVVWIGPGWLLGGAWQQGLVGVLQDIGVQVAVGDPGALAQQQLTLAAILSLSGPFAALGRIVVSRLAAAPRRCGGSRSTPASSSSAATSASAAA